MASVGARPAGNRLDFITLVLGVALIAAPWLLSYGGNARAAAASVVAGLAIVACAIVALAELPHLFEEVDVVLGALTAAAPWFLGFASVRHAAAAHLVIGVGVAALSLGELWWERGHDAAAHPNRRL